ncbi:ATP-binding cassette domain-containing protein [Brevibacterium sp. 5221]|uniref:ATP-binding cassette domain-containing protein n=2 Tax=Brevibacterium rongguiense TaxID=2695267 RepID=A0A6N9HBG4_9MICO|nr:ATP-binding cassette domain-containing protein [Brevibacterium rongguiense]
MTAPEPVLDVRGLSVRFGAHPVTHDVDLRVREASVLALVGESGSGKSVTALSLVGLAGGSAHAAGSAVLADGTQLVGAPPEVLRAVRGLRIGMVFQEPMGACDPMYRVGRLIAEALSAHGERVSREAARARVLTALRAAGLADPERIARSFPHELSGGQLQRAMIALATIHDPELLIADEPTTALDVTVQAEILDLLRSIARERAVLLITHDMGVVADVADDVAVMREGRIVEAAPVEQLFAHPQHAYTRTLLASVPRLTGLGEGAEAQPEARVRARSEERAKDGPAAPHAPDGAAASNAQGGARASTRPPQPAGAHAQGAQGAPRAEQRGEDSPAARLHEAVVVHGGRGGTRALDGVSLEVPRGTVVGLVGESGSGKSTIANVLVGQQALTSGWAEVAGTRVRPGNGREQRRVRARIGTVFQDPAGSLNPRRTVGAQLAQPLRTHTDLGHGAIRQRVAALLDEVRLPAGTGERMPHELSGGQKQRVSIARALALDPDLLIADEPTSALDVSVQAGVLELLRELHDERAFASLFISHDLAVIEQIAAHVVVLRGGAVVESGGAEQVLRRPTSDYTRELISAAPVADPIAQARRREAARAH